MRVEHGTADGLAQIEHGCHLSSGFVPPGWRDRGSVAVSRQMAGRTRFLVSSARPAPMGLGPSSTMDVLTSNGIRRSRGRASARRLRSVRPYTGPGNGRRWSCP
jgi:hypothetical protein